MSGTQPASTMPIVLYHQEHHIRFVLCAPDGTELCDVLPERVETMADSCKRSGIGYVKQVDVRLDSLPPVWPVT